MSVKISMRIDEDGQLDEALTDQLKSEIIRHDRGRGAWDSPTIAITNYTMLEITLLTFGGGHWYMKSESGWGFDGVYGSQNDECYNFAHSVGANTWGQFHLNWYDQIKIHLFRRDSTHWAMYLHQSGFGNFIGDSWGQLAGRNLNVRHTEDHWFGCHVRGFS